MKTIPFAPKLLALDLSELGVLARVVRLLHELSQQPAYRVLCDFGAAPTARHDSGASGVFMGYDFHLTDAGPRLIEINTNAGGALLNGLHTADLCRQATVDWLCCAPRPHAEVETDLVATFRADFAAVRGTTATLRTIAIADENPAQQFLRPELDLFVELFRQHGIAANVCDTADLQRRAGQVWLRDTAVDLVYLRDTDFLLDGDRVRDLRAAHLADEVVVTPPPRTHHLLADKRRLMLFCDAPTLAGLGVGDDDAAFLATIVPETRTLAELGAARAWQSRRDWVFKPAAAYGGRAVYRGDKISRRRFEEIVAAGDFLAQRRVEPGLTHVDTADGPREMKFDVRAYAYRDRILLLGARVYQGQVTNFRTPGAGFSAICVAKDGTQASVNRNAAALPASPAT